MKTPRVKDFDPNAKVPPLKSSLDHMPSIVEPKSKSKKDTDISPLSINNNQQPENIAKVNNYEEKPNSIIKDVHPVPRPVRGTVPQGVPPTVPLIPKVKRLISQRQPFDIYEDQYQNFKKIADAERGFINGRGMSQMVREALDDYLKKHGSPRK
jgi:hypothetical protein